MTQFRYDGPVSSVKLQNGPKVFLVPGKTCELPESHPYVATLVARGLLTAEAPEVPAKETKTSKKDAS